MGFSVIVFLAAVVAGNSGVLALPQDYVAVDLPMSQTNGLAKPNEALTLLRASQPLQVNGTAAAPCSCTGKVCGCCQPVKIPVLRINSKVCANVTFLSEKIGATLSLSVGGKVLFKKTVSVKNPAPVCVKFPGKVDAQICAELYKLSVSPKEFEGCARLEGKLVGHSVAKVNLGCFKLPLKKTDQAAVSIESSVAVNDWSNIQDGGQCSCKHGQCSCCQHIKIKQLKINSNVCIDVQFLSSSVGVSVSLTINGKVVFKKTMSLKNPPPICAPFAAGKVCIALYDLSVSLKQVSGCGRLEAKFLGHTVAKVKLGCFKIPLSLAVYGRTPEGVLYLTDIQDAEEWSLPQFGPLLPENFPLTFELEPPYNERPGEYTELNKNED